MPTGQLFGALGGEYRPADTLYVARGGAYEAVEAAWTSQAGAWLPLDLGGASPYVMTLELVGTPQAGTLLCTVLSAETGQPVSGVPVTMFVDYAALHSADNVPHGGGMTNSSGQWTWDPDWWLLATLHPGGFVAGVYHFQVPHPVGGAPLHSPPLIVNGEVTLPDVAPGGGYAGAGYTYLIEYEPASASVSTGWTPAENFTTGWPSVSTMTAAMVVVRVIAMAFISNPPLKPGWSADVVTHWKPPATEGGTCNLFSWKDAPAIGLDKYQQESIIYVMPAPTGAPIPLANPEKWTQGFGVSCHAGGIGQWPTTGTERSGWTGPAAFYVETVIGDPLILTP